MQDGTEDARIPTPVRGNDPADFFTVSVKGHRGFHSFNIARRGMFRLKIVTTYGIGVACGFRLAYDFEQIVW
jgi:hypothetical protein